MSMPLHTKFTAFAHLAVGHFVCNRKRVGVPNVTDWDKDSSVV
jgi:hypothetical protein